MSEIKVTVKMVDRARCWRVVNHKIESCKLFNPEGSEDGDDYCTCFGVEIINDQRCIECLESEGKSKQAGMYRLHDDDPTFHKVNIGKFVICRQSEGSIWIADGNGDGDGGEFCEKQVEAAISDFFDKIF